MVLNDASADGDAASIQALPFNDRLQGRLRHDPPPLDLAEGRIRAVRVTGLRLALDIPFGRRPA